MSQPKDAEVQPLEAVDRDRYEAAWQAVQAEFVQDPRAGIGDADALVGNVLRARGIGTIIEAATSRPAGTLGDAIARYQAAHAIARRRDDPATSPRDLKPAMADYQMALDALLEPASGPSEMTSTATEKNSKIKRRAP